MNPEMKKRMPAKSILLPVISVVIRNSANPSLINGYAHPHRNAAINAKNAAHKGRWKILLFVIRNVGAKLRLFGVTIIP